jgi:hypothetical protein
MNDIYVLGIFGGLWQFEASARRGDAAPLRTSPHRVARPSKLKYLSKLYGATI